MVNEGCALLVEKDLGQSGSSDLKGKGIIEEMFPSHKRYTQYSARIMDFLNRVFLWSSLLDQLCGINDLEKRLDLLLVILEFPQQFEDLVPVSIFTMAQKSDASENKSAHPRSHIQ